MSDFDFVEDSELVAIAREGIVLLKDAKDHPALIGSILLSAGLGLREFGQGLDFVVWDFSGNHVPPNTAKAPPPSQAQQNLQPWEKAALDWASKFLGVLELTPGGAIGQQINSGIASATGLPVDPNATLAQLGSPVPNILGLLGIKLPTQITLSEVLIVAGLVYIFQPLLTAVNGAVGSLIKGATSLIPAIG